MKFKRVNEFFVFTNREKKGIIILLCLILLLITADVLLPLFYPTKKYDFTKWEKQIDEYLALQEKVSQPVLNEMINIDPNQTDSEHLVQIGVPGKVAGNWEKYLKKGGRFRNKEDIQKIYGMTPELFNGIKMFIAISSDPGRIKRVSSTPDSGGKVNFLAERKILGERIYIPVDLNEADSARLENLPGIGPILASRIVRFRKILGGFHSLDQIHEVYGLRPENYLAASPYLFVEKEGYTKFNINFSTLAELGHHPYIGFRTAHRILDLRDRKGKFTAADELLSVMGEDSLRKLVPYLVFGP